MSAFNGTGTFVITGTGLPFVTGTTISSTVVNQLNTDLATGLSTCITKDGQTTPTANIPMGGFKITGIATATATGDALSYGRTATVTALVATTVNGNTINTGTGGLTLGAGKTLTASNTLTFTGTDGSSVAFGTGGTVLYSGGAYVSSIAGTANEITASAATGAVTLSLPIALTFTGKTVTGGTFASPTISGTVAGAHSYSGALTFSAAITYGGVTLSNAVTGTGNMVLSASPTLTGTLTAATATFSGSVTGSLNGTNFLASSSDCAYVWFNSTAGADSKYWDVGLSGQTLQFRLVNDTRAGALTYMTVTRSGITSGQINMLQPLSLAGGTLLATSSALTNGAAAQVATMTNGPTAGNPTKWIPITDNGTTRYIPAW